MSTKPAPPTRTKKFYLTANLGAIEGADDRGDAFDDELQLELQFVLDKQHVTPRELRSLAAGRFFRLRLDPHIPVQLMCCDELIARGRMVSLDGAWGVQVMELTEQSDGA